MEMSDSLKKFINISTRGSVDLTIGSTIGLSIDQISFFKNFSVVTDSYMMMITRVYSQAILTLLTASEIRDFLNLDAGDDPTGGIYFIACLTRQPNFWSNLDALIELTIFKIYMMINGTASTSGTGTGNSTSGSTGSGPVPTTPISGWHIPHL